MLNNTQVQQVENKINNDYRHVTRVAINDKQNSDAFTVSFLDRIDGRMTVWMGFTKEGKLVYL